MRTFKTFISCKTFFFIVCFFSHYSFGQQDFNKFKTLKSEGQISKDFSSLTYEKIEEIRKENRSDLSNSDEKKFLKMIHYGIDELLHSGMVVYGDEVSLYVKSIAEKLLVNKPDLIGKLRFYTLKSNESNAFSTDQGIVFVTTGLISQLVNEAQLAFVLAHEISHYTEKHVVELFEYASKKGNSSIRDYSIYSKDKELEADKIGLELYKDAGYSKDELLPSFDVLMYSYLPFEEVEVPRDYFSSNELYIPDNLFTTVKYEIKAIEDYDDSKSSHPNIKKRKEQVEGESDKIQNWGNKVFLFGEKKFQYIRSICRFESVRTDIMYSHYVDALYSILILEKEFPNSIYLGRMKAQAWLGLARFKIDGNINNAVDANSKLEGEIGAMHFFIKKLKKVELITVALRQVHDLKSKYPSDKEVNTIYSILLKELAFSPDFKLDNYSKKNFSDASKGFLDIKNGDSKVVIDSLQIAKVSKYDKIKNKKNADNFVNFDSTKFYLYGISDIIIDSSFTKIFKNYKAKFLDIEKEQETFDKLTYKQQRNITKKEKEENLHLGLKELIIVEPMVFSYRKGRLDYIRSEKLKHNFSDIIASTAKEVGVDVSMIDRDHLKSSGTIVFNERNLIFSFMNQQMSKSKDDNNLDVFPVDFELLNEIKTNYNTSKILFSWVEYSHISRFSYSGVFFSILIYPISFVYFPISIMNRHETKMNIFVLDIEKGNVETGESYYFKDAPRTINLGAHMYSVFNKIKLQKSIK